LAVGAANPIRVELVASPPCEAYRPLIANRSGQALLGSVRFAHIPAFILAAAIVGFATNLSMHLLNLRMQAAGVSGFGIGMSVAIQALGIVIAAPFTKNVIGFCGLRAAITAGALISSAALSGFMVIADLSLWNINRFVFGLGLGLLFTASESLIISRADGENRGRIVGWYATALAAGTTAGPLMITMIGIQGSMPLLWGALLFWLATGPIVACLKPSEELAPVVRSSTYRGVRIAPIAFLSAFVFGMADNGGMAMLSVYSTLSGYDYTDAVSLAVFATIGAIALQIPLGYMATRQEPRALLMYCGVGAIMLLALLPMTLNVRSIAFVIAFCLGGLLEGFYTLGLICITKYYRGMGISTANGYFVSMCGLGELAGPLATGASMEYRGPEGLVLSLIIIFCIYIISITVMKGPDTAQPNVAQAPARS
jgi:MFS family permease